MRTPLYFALAALLCGGGTGLAAGSVHLRLDHSARAALARSGVQPLSVVNYGSFQILELRPEEAARLLAAGASPLPQLGRIRFNQVDFDPLRDPPRSSAHELPLNAEGAGLHLVQFDLPVRPAWREAVQAHGLRLLQPYPGETYLVWGTPAAVASAARAPHVRWQGGFLPQYKINPDLNARRDRIGNVDVHFYNDGDVESVLRQLRKLGAEVLQHAPAQPDQAFFDAWITVDASQLAAIAALPQVVALAYASPRPHYEDEMAAQIVAGNYVGGAPQTGYLPWLSSFGYDGSGVTWAVADTGVDLGHPDLAPRLQGGLSLSGCAAPNGDDEASGGHGTHVAGIIAGLGLGDGAGSAVDEDDPAGFRYGQGLAPGAGLFPLCNGAAWPPAGGWQTLSRLSLQGNAVGMNASWATGEGTAHGYQASERTFDLMVRDGDFLAPGNQPFMIAFSAGNSGPGPTTLTAPKEAKNAISTAASLNFRIGAIDTIADFSSRGPAVDGRVLPTISAPGDQIASTMRRAGAAQCGVPIPGSSAHYALCSGTSMAAPQVSGTLAALTQWWRINHGGTPSPALAKALLVNGALDIGAADIPNNAEGWGRINLRRSATNLAQRHVIDQSVVLDGPGAVHSINLHVVESSRPVRITLAWTDAAGAVGANPALVNDLDLEVAHGADIYRGNVLSAGQSVAGGSADTKNNVENIFLPAGIAGTLKLSVRASALPGDGIPGNGDASDQDFALVCDNCAAAPGYVLSARPTAQAICATSNANFSLGSSAVLGFSGTIAFSASNVPAGATVSATPASVNAGDASTITFAPGSVAAGNYSFNIDASASSGSQTRLFDVSVTTSAPVSPTLDLPGNGASEVALKPTLSWQAVDQAGDYVVEIASDPDFNTLVFTRNVSAASTNLTLPQELASASLYYWRVRSSNICGAGANSPVFTFRTALGPGDCSALQTPHPLYASDVEGDMSAWSTAGSSGASTWTVSTARPQSPTRSWLATDLTSLSDQRLISPPISLPVGELPLSLSFASDLNLEARSASSCWDGGLLEISTNDGASWTQITNAQLLTDPYTGAANAGPAAGLPVWCGTRPYRKSVVDLQHYAGQTVRLRFRVSTDSAEGLEPHGWYVDDIRVKSCQFTGSEAIFVDGFEDGAGIRD